jgi:capsular exopolysaccharide synthesis family protein
VKTVLEKPVYQATGDLLLKKNSTSSLTGIGNQLGQLENSISGKPMGNEIAILHSTSMAERIISLLHLNTDVYSFGLNLNVKNLEQTDIIEISYTDANPRTAALVVNTLMKLYIENDINANRNQTKSARDFLYRQLPLRKAALQSAEGRLEAFKLRNKVLDLKAEATSNVTFLIDLDRQVSDTSTELETQTAKIESIRQIFGISPQSAAMLNFVSESPNVSSLLQQWYETQEKIKLLALQFTDSNPVLINLKEQEAVLRQEIHQQIAKSFVGTSGNSNQIHNAEDIVPLNPSGLQQRYLLTYVNAETERLDLEARLKALYKVISNYRHRADLIPQLELQERQLEREINASDTSYQTLLSRYQQLQVAENLRESNARITTPALIPSGPLKSRQYINVLQGLIGGIVLGVITAILLDQLDRTVMSGASAQELLGYTLLGDIPPFPENYLIPEVIVRDKPQSNISEAFRMLQTNLRFFNAGQSIKIIVISSAVPKEGKSTIAANLAVTVSQLGRKVLLVDADLRNPNQHKIWQVTNEVGLTQVVKGQLDLESAVTEVTPNLELLCTGEVNDNPSVLLESNQMTTFIERITPVYDFIILDSPPLTLAADATILGKLAQGILFVVRPGSVDINSITLAKALLDKADQNVLGLAINDVKTTQQYSNYQLSNVY